jgi:hypothetical protein
MLSAIKTLQISLHTRQNKNTKVNQLIKKTVSHVKTKLRIKWHEMRVKIILVLLH